MPDPEPPTEPTARASADVTASIESLLHAHLHGVFGERDPDRRRADNCLGDHA